MQYSVWNQDLANVYQTRNLAKQIGECKFLKLILMYPSGKSITKKYIIRDVLEEVDESFTIVVRKKIGRSLYKQVQSGSLFPNFKYGYITPQMTKSGDRYAVQKVYVR